MRLFTKSTFLWRQLNMAEGVGFEPTVPCGTAVFKTAALSHSATPPRLLLKRVTERGSSVSLV